MRVEDVVVPRITLRGEDPNKVGVLHRPRHASWDKSRADGQWHLCQDEETLLQLVHTIRHERPALRLHKVQICEPLLPRE
jgi:hypothetical protein